jgi:hypothetical protein
VKDLSPQDRVVTQTYKQIRVDPQTQAKTETMVSTQAIVDARQRSISLGLTAKF